MVSGGERRTEVDVDVDIDVNIELDTAPRAIEHYDHRRLTEASTRRAKPRR